MDADQKSRIEFVQHRQVDVRVQACEALGARDTRTLVGKRNQSHCCLPLADETEMEKLRRKR